MDHTQTQLLIIGAGPGGYVAAFHAADSGLNVTLIDREKNPGGVCLFRGCIPSKALLHVARILSDARDAKAFGVEFREPDIHPEIVRKWKNSVVDKLTGGLGQLSRQRNINFIQGEAAFLDSQNVEVKTADGTLSQIHFDHAIIATGSQPVTLPFAPESPRVMDSTAALELAEIPPRLLVIGGGYIGLELGSVYAELGSTVSVVEMTPQLLPGVDPDLSMILKKRLRLKFEAIKCHTRVTGLQDTGSAVEVTFEDAKGQTNSDSYDKVLIAIGRKPDASSLRLEKTKVRLTDRGFIQINAQRRTDDPAIYAIGDVAGNPMLAHKASHEARVAVDAILGKNTAFSPQAIPAVVFTDPEIAWCGLTQAQVQDQGPDIKILKFPWAASGRAVTLNRTDGLTKIMTDARTGRILGVALVGTGVGEMIAEGVLAVEMGAVAEDLMLSIHPHPTLSETMMEAAESFFGQSMHIYKPPRKKQDLI